ncbi:MAG: hypothetical protein Q7K34_02125 [archaeon]|nr:hypothetical protein [archaeon]
MNFKKESYSKITMEFIRKKAMYEKTSIGIESKYLPLSLQYSSTKPVYVKETTYFKKGKRVKRKAYKRRKPRKRL